MVQTIAPPDEPRTRDAITASADILTATVTRWDTLTRTQRQITLTACADLIADLRAAEVTL